jgi:hypothetical protein
MTPSRDMLVVITIVAISVLLVVSGAGASDVDTEVGPK